MDVIEAATGLRKRAIVIKAVEEDFKQLSKKRYFFEWRKFKETTLVYKLQVAGEKNILGAIGLIDWPEEKRIEIKLLASAVENMGQSKKYEGVAGCLIAFAGFLALTKYGIRACVSLVSKTELIDHYMRKYHFKYAGWQLYLEGIELINLLNKHYEH